MDTRQKIVRAQQVSATGPCIILRGYFDPLHAAQVRELHHLVRPGETVVVALEDPSEPLFPIAARAELVAALSIVDYVVTDANGLLDVLPGARAVDLRSIHAGSRDSLSAHVIRRHRGE